MKIEHTWGRWILGAGMEFRNGDRKFRRKGEKESFADKYLSRNFLNDTAAQSMQLALGRGVKEGGSRISFICPIRSVIPPPRSLFLFGRIAQVYSGGVNDASYWPRRMRVENTRWIGSVTAERRRALQPAPGSSKARKEERRGGVFFGFT